MNDQSFAEVSFVNRSLDDLDRELAAGDLSVDDHTRLRAHYETLRASGPALPARRSVGRIGAQVAAVVLFAAGAGWLLARTAGERGVGQSITGASVSNVPSMLAEARGLLGVDRSRAAGKFNDVLAAQPDNAEARTYLAWITRLDTKAALDGGSLTGAEARPRFEAVDGELSRAARADPLAADANCFQTVVRFRDLGSASTANESLRACQSAKPTQAVAALVANVGSDIDAALAVSTDPVVAGLAVARQARSADPRAALTAYDKVLAVDAANVEAVTWKAWITSRIAIDAGQRGLLAADKVAALTSAAEAALQGVVGGGVYADASCAQAALRANRGDATGAQLALTACKTGVATPELRDLAIQVVGI